jgi:Gluconate 2-dehydrogenase subunit 3
MKRRRLLQALAATSAAPFLPQAPLEANVTAVAQTNRTFSPHQFATLSQLCQRLIPADETAGGAIEAKVPELIDLLASENERYRTRLMGGLAWLDSQCHDRFDAGYLGCTADQQKAILDLIAYRENAETESALSQGIAFFSFLRELTLGGYFTSEIGIKFLPYLGNKALTAFPGCPPIPNE